MIEAVLLQIPPPVREVLQVHAAYHSDHLMYAEHVLLHRLIAPLLDLISWHHSHACCRMSSPCASAGPTQRYLYPHAAYEPICSGTLGDWQRCGGAY